MFITITSKRDGFRRCGMAHPATPTTHDADTFTDEQLQELKDEPMLVVAEGEESEGNKPEGEDLTAAIVAVIQNLDKDNDFTSSGTPKVKSIEQALGYDVTAAEVADAFKDYNKDNE